MRGAVIGGLLGLAACSRGDLPLPAVPGLSLGSAEEAEITDRVWLDETPGAPRGAFLAFLSDGTLIQDSCGELWRLSPWRRVDATTLVWEEDGATIRAEIALAGDSELALAIAPPGGEAETGGGMTRRFRAAEAPMVCPEPG
ncbi:hypothetical protein [Amaricoccus solimangrovi]|uniref:Copper resistance protein NlpE n=1 Tax=Amaricoccus solimangrovi TaxID=2589815 RepID=A0A501WKD9_9RHOB|nr:hypothetical protein [Amaricoccus solimangrovi]TPE48850.1 hypothetical protein FJM51_16710 [Amaricoccus solimangrovi]